MELSPGDLVDLNAQKLNDLLGGFNAGSKGKQLVELINQIQEEEKRAPPSPVVDDVKVAVVEEDPPVAFGLPVPHNERDGESDGDIEIPPADFNNDPNAPIAAAADAIDVLGVQPPDPPLLGNPDPEPPQPGAERQRQAERPLPRRFIDDLDPPQEPQRDFVVPPGQSARDFFNLDRFPPLPETYRDYGNDSPRAGYNRYLPDLEVRYPQHPPTNGPMFRARMKGTDPRDEPVEEPAERFREAILRQRFGDRIGTLAQYGYSDEKRNLRLLKYYNGSVERVVQYYHQTCMDIRIGDRVIRDIDWIWGDQDSCEIPVDPRRDLNDISGRDNHFGVVRGLRRWHPDSGPETEAVVQWDNNYVGNYRYGHQGAYDIRVIARGQGIRVRPLHVGDTVTRGDEWKNDDEDGGPGEHGEVIELYSAPTTFAPGVRVAVMWDKDEEHWCRKAAEYREKTRQEMLEPDYERQERLKFPEGRWLEPDILCRPPVRYRWGIATKYDLWPIERLELKEDEYLQVTDQVRPGRDHQRRDGEPQEWFESTVMAVDQWDPLSFPIRGDRVTVLHNPKVKYRFNFDSRNRGKVFDCELSSRGEDFTQGLGVPLRVGDRVTRGPDWLQDYYENEDGGEGAFGTVTAINYSCSITSMLAKVRWPNGTENLYGWGWKNRYELRRVE